MYVLYLYYIYFVCIYVMCYIYTHTHEENSLEENICMYLWLVYMPLSIIKLSSNNFFIYSFFEKLVLLVCS